jgi:hypothetical protein
VEIDPTYARDWALLAICKTNSVMLTGASGDLGWTAAERALALDDPHPGSRGSLARADQY